MSASALGHVRAVRRLCQGCAERKARFAYRGRVRADRDHTLCFECYRAERDRQRARRLARILPDYTKDQLSSATHAQAGSRPLNPARRLATHPWRGKTREPFPVACN